MMRPLTIAALALTTTAALAFTAMAQTTPAEAESPAAPVAPVAAAPAQTAPAPLAPAPTAAGDAEKGRMLTYTCQGCHGVEGYKNAYPNYHVPKIGGQSAEYLASSLIEYQKGTRKHPTMQAQAQSFSEQDIADIAAFLSSLK